MLTKKRRTINERPPLPPPPERHPSANWWNHFNLEAEVNTEADYNIRKLIDRWGKPPHVAYLPCQLSWEWPENLQSVYWCIDQVNKWKARDPSISFNRYYGKSFGRAGDWCFFHAFQEACFGLGKPGLVNRDHGDRFCVSQGNIFPDGVVPEGIDKFFNFVRAERVPLDCVELFKVYSHMTLSSTEVNRDHWDRFCVSQGNIFPDGVVPEGIDKVFNFVRAERVPLDCVELFKIYSHMTLSSTAVLDREARELPPRHYIVHAAQDLVEHCFTFDWTDGPHHGV
ncbi:hypothetical protein PHMEG_00025940 [Phytophthora megakarya]|uniref:Uncharacterized protein n=1 Tax=Phytophthora megakarya TaxID=4795 RepID=A0A225VC17_9STRA|nr:hypothetical protein PHMEG_00025940 [Phytophthora megakarya]